MGLQDLGRLFKGRNIIFGILVIWLITAYTILYFALYLRDMVFLARLIFYPLLLVCLVLFVYTAFFRGDIRHFTWKNLGKAGGFVGISIVIYIIVGYVVFVGMIDLFTSLLFVVSIFSYIAITAVFSMYFCFEQGVKLDDTVYKAPTGLAFFLRWGLFILCILISFFMVWYGPRYIAQNAPLEQRKVESGALGIMLAWLPLLTVGIIVGLTVAAIVILLIRGKFNAWLGIFFFFISAYVTFLMVGALFTVRSGNTLPILIARMVMFGFDMFLLLVTLGGLVGKKADLIGEKLKVINSDAIMIWLIFAKAAFEYSDYVLPSGELTLMKGVAIFYLIIPLCVLMGIIGIAKYGSMKKARKRVKIKKKRVKKSKAQVDQIKKDRAKSELEAQKQAEKEAKKRAKEKKSS